MRRLLLATATLLLVLSLAPPTASGVPTVVVDPNDDKVTGQQWVRHDGGTDAAIEECNDDSSDPTPADPADGDFDPNDGGSARQNNEPYAVVDPTDPLFVVTGWNDYCLTDLDAGWQGFGYSLDGGESWTNSFVPGYPQDTSEEGMESPLFGVNRFAGDPIAAFDSSGNLFVGGISFNRAGAVNGHVYVATYAAEDHESGYPVDYLLTRIVGRGTPSRNIGGIFQDKPMLEVDRTGGDHDGNVYVCWSRFTGNGQNKAYFSRSTDMGETFSRPIPLSRSRQVLSVQGCDIAVEADGDVYVTYRTFGGGGTRTGLAFNRSTDGGASFSRSRLIRSITPYFPFDGARDCGDGVFECPTGYVFARIPLEPRVTSDQSGELPGVHLVYNEVDPGSIVPADTSYSSAGGGRVGQSLVYVVSSTNDGATWSEPVAVDPAAKGHQFFPDADAFAGNLAVVWQDSRTDECYSVQLPMGNDTDAQACGYPEAPETDIVNTFVAVSDDGETFGASTKVSDVGHQPEYEMFGNRNIPFQGDYNWISLAQDGTEVFAYFAWTDNRDVVPGDDLREATQDGFDVHQCRTEEALEPDTCPNAGGLDQNIYGNSMTISP